MTNKTNIGDDCTHTPQTRPSHLFLVRVWAEEDCDGNAEWCGKVQHVLTGKAGHFTDLEKVAALFISLMPEEGAEQIDVSGEHTEPAEKAKLSTAQGC